MLGIIYCLLAVLIGKEAAGMFFASGDGKNNKFWILSCGAFGTGILIFGWSTYMSPGQRVHSEHRNRSFTGMCS